MQIQQNTKWYESLESHRYKGLWDSLESPETRPRRLRNVVEIEYEELEAKAIAQGQSFVQEIVGNLYAGDFYLVRNTFSKNYLRGLIQKNFEYWKSIPPSFHKMLDACPDFHVAIDEKESPKYYGGPIKHSYYFYPWNQDPLNLYEPIREKWRVFKFIGGMEPLQYEQNLPRDGVCDRIQFAHYPTGCGKIDTHEDPYKHVKPIISVFMSQRGEDFQKGGVYFVDKNNSKVDVEASVRTGDAGLAYPTVAHGVDCIDPGEKVDWGSPTGRWWLGMFSNASDAVK